MTKRPSKRAADTPDQELPSRTEDTRLGRLVTGALETALSESTSARKQPAKKLGRPRKIEQSFEGDPREEILAAAATLFEKAGFAGTTTRQIATAVGLTQGAMFHYFPTKVDILLELVNRTVDPALEYHEKLQATPDLGPVERLCLLSYRDALGICSAPHNEAALATLPEVQGGEFAIFWKKRERLRNAYRIQLTAGTADGSFISDEDERGLFEIVCALVESSIWWFRRDQDDADHAARLVTRNVLRLVLPDSSSVSAVVESILDRFATDLPD
ncbi:TetR/AcrR family transcriptional regulator [Streptomyces sp. NPDC001663]|uniref:TetR/AcrR family transcriptional regulator n=1 Tax=Streptomyces sp. NPDC001663 TaxID=3364597 RepID=UPI003676F063